MEMKNRDVEILAPAGSFEGMTASVNAGADAVYIGGSRFGARAYANNLDEEAMLRAIDFMHLHGRRIYMTVNTLVKEREFAGLFDYMKPYYEAGLDAALVQDLGVFSFMREYFPELPLHVSTQMTVTGKYSAADLKRMGAVRVVPARELSLEEIREIYTSTGMEVETFVHGALCYCYSGQCLFSSLLGGRSGNRGRCAQTCRLPFDVLREGKRLNRKDDVYPLSLKDLCTLDLLPDILEAGVCSLKIEGRMKSPRYAAGVTGIYRKYVDRYLKEGREGYHVDKADRQVLLDLFDRGGQSDGYYKQHNGRNMVVLKEKPAFKESNQELFDFLDERYVKPQTKETIKGTAYVAVGQPVRLTAEYAFRGQMLCEVLEEHGEGESRHLAEKAACAASLIVQVEGDTAEAARSAPADEAGIRRQLMKTGDSPFVFESLRIEIKGDVFVPVQSINRLRRELLTKLEAAVVERYRRSTGSHKTGRTYTGTEKEVCRENAEVWLEGDSMPAKETRPQYDSMPATTDKGQSLPELTVLASKREQLNAVLSCMEAWMAADRESQYVPGALRAGIYLASEEFGPGEWKELVCACHVKGISCYLMLPRIFRNTAEEYFLKNLADLKDAGFDAFGAASMEEPGFLRKYLPQAPVFFDHGMYCFNQRAAAAMKEYGASRVTVPVELNRHEIAEAGVRGEILLYGYLPVMVSAQCIKKTTESCTKKEELLYLRDRKGKEFPVRNTCRFCYNTIYNSAPLSLAGLSEEVKRLPAAAWRLNFTIEDRKETEAVLTDFYREYVLEGFGVHSGREFTRSHFKRGVE